ncbi:MAG TPA: methyltransferase [Xanthobacteraceae bacterium]|nr:methyltransferase [Xanthobacteraceae bacterium]
MAAESGATSDDAVLGGRLILRQPLSGHRVGHDAILLAAATSAQAGDHAVDLGAGVGAAGLALARRIEGVSVTLVEIDPALAELACGNAERNGLASLARSICLDVTASAAAFSAAGLLAGSAHHVLMNPPFNAPANPSPDASRRRAHNFAQDTLSGWVRTASRLLRPSGTLTLIWRADGAAGVLAALAAGYGAVSLLPIYGKPRTPAIRILLRAVKASRAPLVILPGLLLSDSQGQPTAEADAVLRGAAPLRLADA